MRANILGTTLPVLEIELDLGDSIVSETGQLAWKSPHVAMRTSTALAGAGGFFSGLVRSFSGSSIFMTEYTAASPGAVAFTARVPGTILPMQLDGRRDLLVHRHGFLCGTAGITLGTGFQQSLGAGLFGGEGYILQRVGGQGTAWVELGGELVTYTLGQGDAVDVHPGHVGMFESSVTMTIVTVPGLRNKLFGGDGLFLARLTGPGQVWLQTLTVPGLAHALEPYLPKPSR